LAGKGSLSKIGRIIAYHIKMSKMNVYNLPEDLLRHDSDPGKELAIFNYEVSNTVMKNKINLHKSVISFLVEGQKDVRFADESISIDTTQSLLISSGNFLMTEHIGSNYFKCLLFFFSHKNISDFFIKHPESALSVKRNEPAIKNSYFKIEKDAYIDRFVASLAQSFELREPVGQHILSLKFEEIILYLSDKYGQRFLFYLNSLLSNRRELSFKSIVENNVCSNLSIEEIAFLCNMSLSTFKRKFIDIYHVPPGKWFQKERLHKAREMMAVNKLKASEIYMDFGYNNLSNFSAAFKNEFGFSPKQVSSL
jgi:AraC-like DNA-binding protein